ncbi:TLD-domain containing nucleolar protein [Tasmannia lanceolata]|uniref:TLD-domain containing nucleolar protein n=1 Tax=Tasmannia lanceolata TaxID=3420 RepID=UPI0040628924
MGQEPSFRSKAAHFVSDLTTVLLNPISDEPQKPHNDNMEIRSEQESVTESDSGVVVDGPDTSSFTAFLYSLLSSSESKTHPNEEHNEYHAEMDELASDSGIRGTGKKSLISIGKQSLRRAIYRTARTNGFIRQGLEKKAGCNVQNDSELVENELRPLQPPKETVSQLILPEISEPSLLLSEKTRNSLYISLPALVKGRKWVLLYSTWRHGISLSTLYRRSMLCPGYCLLVVGDRRGGVFGGLVEAPLRPTNKRKYQGTNNTFVFTNISGHVDVFCPTGANRYFTLCSTDFLALGGGSHFALYLDGDLLNGSSSVSETFGNSCLAHSEDFEVKEVELWGFAYASKYEELIALCRTEAPGICRW